MTVRDPVLRKVKWLLSRDPTAAAEMAREAELGGAGERWTKGDVLLAARAYSEAAEGLAERRPAPGGAERLASAAGWHLAAADAFVRAGDPAAAAESFAEAGDLFLALQELASAEDAFDRSGQLAAEAGEGELRADALASLGTTRLRRGDLSGAESALEQARAAFEALDHRKGQARALGALGELGLRSGDLDGALARFDRALAIYEELEDRRGQARTLKALGAVRHRRGEPEAARDALARARDLCADLWDRAGEADAFQGLGNLALEARDAERARVLFREAIASHAIASDLRGLSADFGDLARAEWSAGRTARAVHCLEASLALHRRLALSRLAAADLRDQGEAFLGIRGQAAAALACFRLAAADDRAREVQAAIAAQDPAAAARIAGELDGDAEAVRRRGVEALLDDPALAVASFEDQLVTAEAAEDAGAFVAALVGQALGLARAGRLDGAVAALAVADQALGEVPEPDRAGAVDRVSTCRAEVSRIAAGHAVELAGDPELVRAAAVEAALDR